MSWDSYINQIKEAVGRKLTEKEISRMMQFYITGVSVEKALEELK